MTLWGRSLVYQRSRAAIGGASLKPSPFAYHPVRSVAAAAAALAEFSPQGGRILAGGQSLLPMMAFRLAQPAHLIDINTIPGLDRVAVQDGVLRVPACVRHAAFERSPLPGPLGKILATVAGHIAHHPIRTRGTFCGSVANADPASEWCVVACALGASFVAISTQGERHVPAESFFVAAMTTQLRPDEFLAETRLTLPPPDTRYGFSEHSRRAGDYALSMTFAALRVQEGAVFEARVALGGAESRPRRLPSVESVLVGAAPGEGSAARAAEAAAETVDPMEDAQVCASLRRDLVRVTTRRALLQAMA